MERMTVWGTLQTIIHFSSGFRAWISPFIAFLGSSLMTYRAWFIHKGVRAVEGDRKLLDVAWERIQSEEGAAESMMDLGQIEQQIEPEGVIRQEHTPMSHEQQDKTSSIAAAAMQAPCRVLIFRLLCTCSHAYAQMVKVVH